MPAFTSDDIKQGLSQLTHLDAEDRATAFDFMTAFFNGHLFCPTEDATNELYNPQLNFFQALCTDDGTKLLRDWRNGGDEKHLVERVDDANLRLSDSSLALSWRNLRSRSRTSRSWRRERPSLRSEVTWSRPLRMEVSEADQADLSLHDARRGRMLAFMFANGIVTFDSKVDQEEPGVVYLKVPNAVLRFKGDYSGAAQHPSR